MWPPWANLLNLTLSISKILTEDVPNAVAAGGIALPVAVSGVALFRYRNNFYSNGVFGPKPQFLGLLGIQFAATSLRVVTRILAELKLLGTDIGRFVMTTAIINEVVVWAALPPLLTNLGLIVLCWFCVRPTVWWIQQETPEGESVGHGYLSMILGATLLSGFLADGIGVHYLAGGFAFGPAIPSGPVATALVEMLEEFITILMLPLYFTLGGVTTDLTALFSLVAASPPEAPAVSGPTTAFLITPLLVEVAKIDGTVAASLSLKNCQHADKVSIVDIEAEVLADPSELLTQLAKDAEELAVAEHVVFSPTLRRWHGVPGVVAAATLHGCFGVVLRQYLARVSCLSDELVRVLHSTGKLERVLVQMVVEDDADCDGGGKVIVREMVPYHVDSVVVSLLKAWMEERLRIGRECLNRAQETEVN